MIIGITGNFGSGKTAVAEMFSEYGFEVINVDKLYHDNIYKHNSFKKKIERQFGTTDREKLKKIVFNDPEKLKKLNKITHPLIIKELKKKISEINKKFNREKNIIIDAPLLLETKAKNLVERIIVVKTNKKNCFERINKKNKYSKKDFDNITKSQMPLYEKMKHADFIVDNNGQIEKTKAHVKKIIKLISKEII